MSSPRSGRRQPRRRPILAPHALLIEAETGSVLFEKQADDLVAPASLAKLMTVNVVFDQLQLGNINLDDEYVISVNAWRKGGAPSRGSTMYAALNSRVKVEDLLKGVMIQSANDGCIALAEGIAGNETEFVRMMNDRAREIGLTKSYFTNVDGLPDPKMRVTPRELASWRATSSSTIPTTTNGSASANSPGTRSASRTAIRCSARSKAPTA